nr:unnamed protein product [Digitaria exilis]
MLAAMGFQKSRVFNVSPKRRLENVRVSFMGFMVSMFHSKAGSGALVALVAAAVLQMMVVVVLLFPLGVVYVFGLYISTGISLWRLIQRDYGATEGDPNTANLTPALNILYLLPLVQGVLLCYRAIFSVSNRDKVVVDRTMERYKFDEDAGRSVWEYFRETMAGCEKDPSFARGRNLITYAVDLMAITSHESYLSGLRILDMLLGSCSYKPRDHTMVEQRPQLCRITAKVLLESVSGTQVIWKVLRTLEQRVGYDETTRAQAARVLEHFGSYIHLEQFLGWFQRISHLLETSDRRPRPEMVQGMRILRSLATNSGNVAAITGSPGLIANITALLGFHRAGFSHQCDDALPAKTVAFSPHRTARRRRPSSLSLRLLMASSSSAGGFLSHLAHLLPHGGPPNRCFARELAGIGEAGGDLRARW